MAKRGSFHMTICPECVQYVRHCRGQSTIDCPFCDAAFCSAAHAGTAPSAAAVPRGLKQGVMAISFVGATVLSGLGCATGVTSDDEIPTTDGELDCDSDEDVLKPECKEVSFPVAEYGVPYIEE